MLPVTRSLPLAFLCLSLACVHAPPAARASAEIAVGGEIVPAPSRNEAPADALSDAEYLWSRRLMVPVAGIAPEEVRDTYHAKRGARLHRALDILAPRRTPVLATDDGRIFKLRRNALGGITLYLVDTEERFIYYYAHLQSYRAGLAAGDRVEKGEVIAYVGTSGNAPRNTPHLHFQMSRLDNLERWGRATPMNPHPFFALEGEPLTRR